MSGKNRKEINIFWFQDGGRKLELVAKIFTLGDSLPISLFFATLSWRWDWDAGSFVYVWLILKYFLLLTSRFLRNEDILPDQKVIVVWRSVMGKDFYRYSFIFIAHIFLIVYLRCSKIDINGWDSWVVRKIRWFYCYECKIWEFWQSRVNFCYFSELWS